MKVFVLGSTGMLGHVVSRYFKEQFMTVVDMTRKDIDATWDIHRIDWAMRSWNITDDDFVINCIGLVPQVSENQESHYKINTLFPMAIATTLQSYGGRLIHISTNCVYSGDEVRAYNPHGYTEWDMPIPHGIYGLSKLRGEPYLGAMVLRTSIVGPQLHGSYGLYSWCLTNRQIKGYTDHYWNGVTTLQLAKYMHWLIENKQFAIGLRHIHSPNTVSKYELIKEIHAADNFVGDVVPTLTMNPQWKTLATVSTGTAVPSIHTQLKELAGWYGTH